MNRMQVGIYVARCRRGGGVSLQHVQDALKPAEGFGEFKDEIGEGDERAPASAASDRETAQPFERLLPIDSALFFRCFLEAFSKLFCVLPRRSKGDFSDRLQGI